MGPRRTLGLLFQVDACEPGVAFLCCGRKYLRWVLGVVLRDAILCLDGFWDFGPT